MTDPSHIKRLTLRLARDVLARDTLAAVLADAQAVVIARRQDLHAARAALRASAARNRRERARSRRHPLKGTR